MLEFELLVLLLGLETLDELESKRLVSKLATAADIAGLARTAMSSTLFSEISISRFAIGFMSTNEMGKIPIEFPIRPSAQFRSTRRNTLIMVPFVNDRQPSSSFFFILKSYNALHCGIDVMLSI